MKTAPIRTALIGLGMVSGVFADAIATSDRVGLSWVHARSATSRNGFLQRWPALDAAVADSVQQIADDPDVGFVIVATPPNARAEIVDALVAAGKPILMEKPVERNLEAATQIVERCEAAGVPLGIVLQHRTRPEVAALREAAAGLGPLMAVEINVPWWRPQSYYDEPGRGTYARDGGGVLLNQAIHTIDLALSLAASVSAGPVRSVMAMAATTGLHDMEAEDFVSAGLTFAGGAVGQLFATTASFPGREETISLHHRDGSAFLAAGRLRIDRHDGTTETFGATQQTGAGANPMAFSSDSHRRIIEDFADSLEHGRTPIVSGREALVAHRLIDALERSAAAGTRIELEA